MIRYRGPQGSVIESSAAAKAVLDGIESPDADQARRLLFMWNNCSAERIGDVLSRLGQALYAEASKQAPICSAPPPSAPVRS